MRSKIIALMAAAALWAPWAANGASLFVVGGYLDGAFGVEVSGRLYDVEFVDGSCVSLFGGCDAASDFAFDQAGATAASAALLAQVFVDGPLENFDSLPLLTYGCPAVTNCDVLTPYGLAGDNVLVAYAWNHVLEADDAYGASVSYGRSVDTSLPANVVYARWTPAPEPGTLTLLGLGLAGLASTRRRKQ